MVVIHRDGQQADPAPALVVVDAWLDTVSPGLSVRDPQQARQALHPWREVATTTEAAVLLLTHTNRVASAQARDKYGATGELRTKARMTLFAQTDDEGRLVVGPDKSNMSATIPASVFAIEAVAHFEPAADDDGTVPRLAYQSESTQTAREHITENYAAEHGGGDAGKNAVAWLAVFLAQGPRWATDIKTAATEAGISEKRLNTAKKTLNATSERNDSTGPWFWALPQHEGMVPDPPDDPDAPVSARRSSDSLGSSEGVSARRLQASPLLFPDDLSTSQDCLMTSRETQGHLGHLDSHHNNVAYLPGERERTPPPVAAPCRRE